MLGECDYNNISGNPLTNYKTVVISEDLQKSYLLKNETAALASTLSANVAAESTSSKVIKVETDSKVK